MNTTTFGEILLIQTPNTSNRRVWMERGSVFAIGFALFWLTVINDDWGDQYFHFRMGERVARGEVPYRDFFTINWPGLSLFLGLWFKLFGATITSVHVLHALAGATGILLSFEIARCCLSSVLRWAVPLVVLAASVLGNEGISHMTFSMPLALAAMVMALHSQRLHCKGLCILAGMLAGLCGVFTVTTGLWLTIALILSGAALPTGKRLKWMFFLGVGSLSVVLLMMDGLAIFGALHLFIEDTVRWTVERYIPFHAGVSVGAWLPPWSLLNNIQSLWLPTMVVALGATWGLVLVLSWLPLLSLVRWFFSKNKNDGHLLLILCAGGLFLSAYPHAGSMRLMRLSLPLWILFVYELEKWPTLKWLAWANRPRLAACLVASVALVASPMQWSYRHSLKALDTPRGTVFVNELTYDEYQLLSRLVRPGSAVCLLPDYRPSAWLHQLNSPTSYDALVPILFTVEQQHDVCTQLEAAGRPPIIYFKLGAMSTLESIQAIFKPTKFVEEWNSSPHLLYIDTHYHVKFNDTLFVIFVRN